MFLQILLEGTSDVPTVRSILNRKFGLVEGKHFQLHPHRGKGRLPSKPLGRPDPKRKGLLDRLPHKLRGYSYLGDSGCVVVLLDSDDQDCRELLQSLNDMLNSLDRRPKHVLFRIAIEEIESWFLADPEAIKAAYPRVKLSKIPGPPHDQVIGAWETLATALGRKPSSCTGADKADWAARIIPLLDLTPPKSPSLAAFIRGVSRLLDEQ